MAGSRSRRASKSSPIASRCDVITRAKGATSASTDTRRTHEPHRDRHRIVERRGVVAHPSADDWVVHHHLARDIAEEASTEPDDPRVAIHEMSQDAGAPDDDRKREPDPEHDE